MKISANIWLLIMIVIFAVVIIYFQIKEVDGETDTHQLEFLENMFLLIWGIMLFFPIYRKIFIELKISKLYKNRKVLSNERTQLLVPTEKNLNEQLGAMDEYLSKNCVIPKKYWDYALNIVNYIYVDYRATNLREAINILEEDMHRSRLENKMLEIEKLAKDNANAINDMMKRIDNIECFQDYLSRRQSDLEWDMLITKSRS